MSVENTYSQIEHEAQNKHENAAVLVVDDNDHLLTIIGEVLHSAGFNVTLASSGADALQRLRDTVPDVIISDIMMPEMDGHQFQNAVMNNTEWCQIPFVFLSALSDPDQVRETRARGCDDYILKPFDPTDLVALVRGKVEQGRKRLNMNRAKIELYHRRIIHTLSHEFRTPLVSINTGTELLLESNNKITDTVREKLLESIYRGGQRLQRLVDDFMLLQQIDSGQAERVCREMRKSMPVLEIVETGVSCFFETSKESGVFPQVEIKVDSELEDVDLYVDVYDIHLISVLQRLLGNACKFAGADKPIIVRISSDNTNVTIHIIDHGTGLEKGETAQAIELFSQIGRDKREQQGCGLGLTISEYFVRLNGGRMSFHEPDDAGLDVQISFPLSLD